MVEINQQIKLSKTRKTLLVALAIMMTTMICPNTKAAFVNRLTVVNLPVIDLAKENSITVRVNEIRTIEKSRLTHEEKKSLRKELRSLKTQLKDLGGRGIYLSAGAIIIIILLLILIL